MKKIVLLTLMLTLSACCPPGPDTVYDVTGSESVSNTIVSNADVIIVPTGNTLRHVTRFVDEEMNNVCYIYASSITCVPFSDTE